MGQVYEALDTRLQRSVALKIVHCEPDDAGEGGPAKDSAARLLFEAQTVARLAHPNVIVVYEVGAVSRRGGAAARPYIAMELVRGAPLRAFIGDESVPIPVRVRWLADTAAGLGAAHACGLVHRDVKPMNVMIRADGVAKVLDFGLAKRTSPPLGSASSVDTFFSSITDAGAVVGTPLYMSPEQMRREVLDGRSDQFSWGVLAYELLAGELPWGDGVDALGLLSKLLTEDPTPLDERRPDVPAGVARVVARALAKKRDDRFPTMRAVVDALTAACAIGR